LGHEAECILGPVMLINGKFDISCKLDISRNLSTLPSQLY